MYCGKCATEHRVEVGCWEPDEIDDPDDIEMADPDRYIPEGQVA